MCVWQRETTANERTNPDKRLQKCDITRAALYRALLVGGMIGRETELFGVCKGLSGGVCSACGVRGAVGASCES